MTPNEILEEYLKAISQKAALEVKIEALMEEKLKADELAEYYYEDYKRALQPIVGS